MPKGCPSGSITQGAQKGDLSDCRLAEGYYCAYDKDVCTPTLCPSGSYCPGKPSVTDKTDTGLRACDPTLCASTCSVVSPVGSIDASTCGCECIPVDCVMSDWVDSTACQPTNTKVQTRTVQTPAVNGGAACPSDLTREQPCVYCTAADVDNFELGNINNWDKTTTMASEWCPSTIMASPASGCTALFFPFSPFKGSYSAYNSFDGYTLSGQTGVTQYCTKPTYNLSAGNVLNFAWIARWNMLDIGGSFPSTLPRTFAVEVKDGNGIVQQSTTILTAPPRTKNQIAGWIEASVPMTKAVNNAKLCFVWAVPESHTGPGSAGIDNVALACAPAP